MKHLFTAVLSASLTIALPCVRAYADSATGTAPTAAPTTAPTPTTTALARTGALAALDTSGSLSSGIAYCAARLTGPLTGRTWCLDALVVSSGGSGGGTEVGAGLSVSLWGASEPVPTTSQAWAGIGSLAPYEHADKPTWRLIAYVVIRR